MRYLVFLSCFRRLAGLFLLASLACPRATAQDFWPLEFGSTVNGYQDDFDGPSLQPHWTPTGASQGIYAVSDGMLHVTTAGGDPNHLLYALPGYDSVTQEVLARIRFTNFGTGDPARAGLGVGVDPGSSHGINFHFRDYNTGIADGRHLAFLDDLRAWGPQLEFRWENGKWYWVRLRQEENAAFGDGSADVFAKIWPADGSAPEPAGWHTWDYIPERSVRAGFAGITAGSSEGISEFDVDYILIKAQGLPAITAAAEAFPLFTPGPVTISTQPASQTVAQCSPVTFEAGADGTPPYQWQWHRNGMAIPGATNDSYTLASVQSADDGAVFHVRLQNADNGTTYSTNSAEAILTVLSDTTAPTLVRAENNGLDRIMARFSEPITLATATNLANYRIESASGPLPVLSASLAANQTDVLLSTTGQVEGIEYTLTLNGIVDQCTGINRIAADTQVSFLARVYSLAQIGEAPGGGGSVGRPGGYDVTGAGSGLLGGSDQFFFSHVQRTGDFDVKVRVDSFASGNAWAEAGLMVRESLAANSAFAGVFATPSINGALFKSRNATSAPQVQTGSFPVNYPQTWLRLARTGALVTGYASFDGQRWRQLGSAAVSGAVYFGFAVASHDATEPATAAFRDLEDVSGTTIAPSRMERETLGQSSRKTSLVFSEIMYHPSRALAGVATLEFVELLNTLDTPEDLSGYQLDGDIHYTFPPGTSIPGGGFLVIASMPGDVEKAYGLTGVLGPWRDNLPNKGGRVQLRGRAGPILLEVNYEPGAPWPVAADGAGHSLVLARPSLGEDNPAAWSASQRTGGSPGRMDAVHFDPQQGIVINELLAHTDDPDRDFIELFNPSQQEIDLSGCILSDHPETNKFVIPSGTKIAARGFISFTEDALGFSLEANGETIFLRTPDGGRVLDAIRFEGQQNGVAYGRYPDGGPVLRALASRTPGQSNTPFLPPEVMISEIMHSPISRDNADEYVELYNRTEAPVDLSGWKMNGGIDFTFASNTVLQPKGYLVLAASAARMRANYPHLNESNLAGDFIGTLSNNGERLSLVKPAIQVAPDSTGQLATNTIYIVVNEVTYGVGGAWGQWSAKGGSSLELIDLRADNALAGNWADSDESAKAPWTDVTVTGRLDHGNVPADQLQVLLQGAGECLIDEVQVLNASNANLIGNPGFESGAAGWTAEGTESSSSLEMGEGFESARSFHVRAVARGDNQLNRIRTPLTSNLAANSTATLRAKVRWLRGHPELLLRLRGNWLEAAGQMSLPKNPGTPGAPNSRSMANAGPAIYEVRHEPVLPAAGEPVLVTARVHDPDGLSEVLLKYRVDPSPAPVTVALRDDGTAGDEFVGDGIFSARIPGQSRGALVAFQIQAVDAATAPRSANFPAEAPARECLVRFGEEQPPGSYPVYRLWMTQATLNAWNSRPKLDNTPLPVTFVLGNQRVIYGAQALYAGSPYISPGYCGPDCGRCGYSISFPEDDLFLGSNDLVLDWPGGHGGESTAIQEQMAYYIAERMGLPYSHRYFIHLHVNGVTDEQRRTIFEAVNQPDSDFIKAWSPGDDDGDFYKIDRAFEFSDGGGVIADPMPTLQNFTTTGGAKKLARYRWNWLKRATDEANNYTNIFNLVDALNAASPEPYTSATESLVDIEEWMGIFAVEHIINNFDSWGHDIGKNMYAYKPENGRWQLYMFDLDWLMLVSNGRYTASNGPLFASQDPVVARMYAHPPFRRAYFRAVQQAVDGPLLAANADPIMDAKHASLAANGVRYCDGQTLSAPTAVKNWFAQRRNYLLAQLATVAAEFDVTSPPSIETGSSPVTLTGTAPVSVKTIQVNGVDWPATWTTMSNWTLQVPLSLRTNQLLITGHDATGALFPGASNTVTVIYSGPLAAPASLAINEWMASNTRTIADSATGTAKYEDWFELYNYGAATVDLAGLYLTDRLNEKSKFQIPAGYSIPPGGYLLVWADGEPEQNNPADPALHADFQLSAGGEAIGLFAADGTEIDSVTFGPQTSDASEGRCPDGGEAIGRTVSATPGAPNQCAPPAPPRFEPIAVSGSQLTMRWTGEPGLAFQLEYTGDLGVEPWQPLGEPVLSEGGAAIVTIDLSGAPRGFYRLRISN